MDVFIFLSFLAFLITVIALVAIVFGQHKLAEKAISSLVRLLGKSPPKQAKNLERNKKDADQENNLKKELATKN